MGLLSKYRLYTILSIDGGGVRGVIPAMVIAAIEEEIGKLAGFPVKIGDLIDMKAGTSTGGLLALALSTPDPLNKRRVKYSGKDTLDLYSAKNLGIIFSKNLLDVPILNLRPKYGLKGIEELLKERLGEESRLGEMVGEVVLTTIEGDIANTSAPHLLSSTLTPHILAWKAGRATTAAPTFFNPMLISDKLYIDGALGGNNPTFRAITTAGRLGHTQSNILVISLGTACYLPSFKKSNTAKLKWAGLFPKLSLCAQVGHIAKDIQFMDFATQGNYYRIDIQSPNDIPMDSIKHLHILKQNAQALIHAETKQIKAIATLIFMQNKNFIMDELQIDYNNAKFAEIYTHLLAVEMK